MNTDPERQTDDGPDGWRTSLCLAFWLLLWALTWWIWKDEE